MASFLRCTLLADGGSDRCLVRVLDWCLRRMIDQREIDFRIEFAHFSMLRDAPKSIEARIKMATDNFPCDVLFVHRDVEKQSRAERVDEIANAVSKARVNKPAVPVIPIRMTEAWFLISGHAIRRAAGNPNGKVEFGLPRLDDIESMPNPKLPADVALGSLRVERPS